MASVPNIYPRAEERLPSSLFGKIDRQAYRKAVKEVVLFVKQRHGLSSLQLADKLICDKDTIENAENEVTSLEAVTLLKIAFHYGEEAIAPVRQLYLCAPVEPKTEAEELADIEGRIRALRIRKERGE